MSAVPPLPDGHILAPMTDGEVAELRSWAVAEGWNPGLLDISIARAVDPDAFIALRDGDELIGGGAILRLAPRLGFMGLFIMRPDRRGSGLGRTLWHYRRDLLLERLEPGATIGMDGVFVMESFYARGGFVTSHRDLRYEGRAPGAVDPDALGLPDLDREEIHRLDAECLGADRRAFLEPWMTAPGVHVAGLRDGDRLVAFGVLRPAEVGYRFGPVLADSGELGARIVGHLLAQVPGEQVQIDVPEPNAAALAMVRGLGLTESFGCARMYHGPFPLVDVTRVVGVTSLEFG